MANSSGLNERPSRTSVRGVATLYQGSIPILLRSLHACEQAGRRLLQPREVRGGHGLEAALSGVHPVPDTVSDDHVARKLKRCNICLRLLERTFYARAQALRLAHSVAVLLAARQ